MFRRPLSTKDKVVIHSLATACQFKKCITRTAYSLNCITLVHENSLILNQTPLIKFEEI